MEGRSVWSSHLTVFIFLKQRAICPLSPKNVHAEVSQHSLGGLNPVVGIWAPVAS